MRYAFPNLSKKQREIMDQIGAGNYSLAGVFARQKALDGLILRGLIRKVGSKRLSRDALGEISVAEYEMPVHIHIQWCEWCWKQPQDDY